jgi:hypothetical protein
VHLSGKNHVVMSDPISDPCFAQRIAYVKACKNINLVLFSKNEKGKNKDRLTIWQTGKFKVPKKAVSGAYLHGKSAGIKG